MSRLQVQSLLNRNQISNLLRDPISLLLTAELRVWPTTIAAGISVSSQLGYDPFRAVDTALCECPLHDA